MNSFSGKNHKEEGLPATQYQCNHLHHRKIANIVFQSHWQFLHATPGDQHCLSNPTLKSKVQHLHSLVESLTPVQQDLDLFQNIIKYRSLLNSSSHIHQVQRGWFSPCQHGPSCCGRPSVSPLQGPPNKYSSETKYNDQP